jgi:hypothetical protein
MPVCFRRSSPVAACPFYFFLCNPTIAFFNIGVDALSWIMSTSAVPWRSSEQTATWFWIGDHETYETLVP